MKLISNFELNRRFSKDRLRIFNLERNVIWLAAGVVTLSCAVVMLMDVLTRGTFP